MLAAHPPALQESVRLATATLRCGGGASKLRVKAEAKGAVAVQFEFRNGPFGFKV